VVADENATSIYESYNFKGVKKEAPGSPPSLIISAFSRDVVHEHLGKAFNAEPMWSGSKDGIVFQSFFFWSTLFERYSVGDLET
jgi:hypothetical protein